MMQKTCIIVSLVAVAMQDSNALVCDNNYGADSFNSLVNVPLKCRPRQ